MKIQHKLFLIFFGFSLVLVTLLVFLMQWSIGKGMINYVNTKEIEALKPVIVELAAEYKKESSWKNIAGENSQFRRLLSNQLKGSEFSIPQRKRPPEHITFRPPPRNKPNVDIDKPPLRNEVHDRRAPPPKDNEALYAVLDINKAVVVGRYIENIDYSITDIIIDNNTVGYFAVSKRNELTQGYEVDFIEQQQYYLWIIALLAMTLVTIVTLPLARHVVEPIKLITRGMHKLTQGDYEQTIQLKRQDELGQLSQDYNELALTLAENDTARKRWLANISHELRTPVAILRGELEAMLDDVRPLSKNNISSANDEVKHLHKLIDDLNLLTSADIGGMHYRKNKEDLTLILNDVANKYQSYLNDAKIELKVKISTTAINVNLDQTRLYQLFENIINNSVKYSSAKSFTISLDVENNNSQSMAIIKLEDDGIGVKPKHLPHLFEHLYRVDNSRNRKTGGSGLGLSICKHIIIAHQGEISAEQSAQGGLAIIIKLPIV